ncbi:MAG: DUF6482 family protein [Pseudomonadota bacterium]
MKITLPELKQTVVDRLVIESVDLSLYIAHAVIDGEQRLIAKRDGSTLKTKNLLEMKKALKVVPAAPMVLLQRSSYDEMCGQGFTPADNAMEVTLGPGYESLPPWMNS